MINLVISSDDVVAIATQEGVQSRHIHRLYSVANQYNAGYSNRFHDNHGNICISLNGLTELSNLMFSYGLYLGLKGD